jgi:hypothetical protein
MTVWGVSSNLEGGEPLVVAVELQGPRGSLSGGEVFRHRTNPKEDWAQKLRALTADLETTLKRNPPDALVVRAMDWWAKRKEELTRKRYQIEGAILAAARRHVDPVESKSGKELGNLCGGNKQDVETEAAEAIGEELKEAGAAAIGALVLAGQA